MNGGCGGVDALGGENRKETSAAAACRVGSNRASIAATSGYRDLTIIITLKGDRSDKDDDDEEDVTFYYQLLLLLATSRGCHNIMESKEPGEHDLNRRRNSPTPVDRRTDGWIGSIVFHTALGF